VSDQTSQRIPFSALAIPFGLAGLAGTWSAATERLDLPPAIAEAFWIVAASAWLALIVAHGASGRRSSDTFAAQLRDPAQGPLAALIPIVAVLLGGHLEEYWTVAGTVVVVAGVVATFLFAAWHLAFLIGGHVNVEAIHGGYFLPTAAGGFIASIGLAKIGLREAAIGAFGVAILFWALILTVLVIRLAFRAPLPAPLVPTLAILLAPPAVGSLTWFALAGVHEDSVSSMLAGVLVLMLGVQAMLLPRYRALSFSLGFWSFTFPFAAAATVIVEWMSVLRPLGWQAIDVTVLTLVTALIAGVALRMLRQFHRDRRVRRVHAGLHVAAGTAALSGTKTRHAAL
jgi:tellurite resistance protein